MIARSKSINIKRFTNNIVRNIVVLFLVILMILLMINVSSVYKPIIGVTIVNIIILYIYPNKNILTKIISLSYFMVLLLFLNQGLIGFSFIPQAKALLDIDSNLLTWFKSGHPHAIRLLVAYPGYMISSFFRIDLNLGFSYYSITMFHLIFLIIMDSTNKLKNSTNIYLNGILHFLCMIPMTILPFLMNGRIVSAYLGFLIIIEVFIFVYARDSNINIYVIALLLLSFTLTAVSSGTLMVSLIYIVVMIYIYYFKIHRKTFFKRKMFFIMLLFSPVIYIVFKYALFMLLRNIRYFGGGVGGAINMLNHGIGRYFILSKFQTIVFCIVIITFLILNFLFIRKRLFENYKTLPLLLSINISIYGLLFGHSTGLMGIPPLIILVLYSIR